MSTPGIDLDAGRSPARPAVPTADAPAGLEATPLPTPAAGRWSAEAYVSEHLGALIDRRGLDLPESSSVIRGGQQAAEAALARFEVAGYAARLDEAYPQPRRSVSGLSPWIRHGLLSLPRLWDHVADGPADDVRAFRGALLWQEYARHRYARLRLPRPAATTARRSGAEQRSSTGRGWNRRMGCVELPLDELEEDGWIVGPARRWLAAHWLGRDHDDPDEGEEHLFRHLLDGSRAANGLGWHRTVPSSVTRWDVEAHAPGLCASCELVAECPIERPRLTADETEPVLDSGPQLLIADPDVPGTTGPRIPLAASSQPAPEAVWLTAESLGDADPALAANPELPAVFVFDRPLLAKLRLSSKRLVFLVETLGDLADRRTVEMHLGDPIEVLAGRPLAATFTPVPGWRRRAAALDVVQVQPWPWLRQPPGGDIATFERWREGLT